MRERGLKHIMKQKSFLYEVAPHAGAWVETSLQFGNERTFEVSLPMRERGLKPGR